MRHTVTSFLLLFALLGGIASHASAQNDNVTLLVTKTNGEELTFQLNENSRISFENGENLIIEITANATESIPLAQIRKLVCSEITGIDEDAASNWQLFPNPTHDSFIIRNLEGSSIARIYSIDGRLMKSFEATDGSIIDISDFTSGMYLLQLNGQTSKLMKL